MRLTRSEAWNILRTSCENPLHCFHALRSEEVEALLAHADRRGYRKPRNANGSRARYFHAYLVRLANKQA